MSGTFNINVLATAPEVQTAEATQVGSRSGRLQANIFELGGMDSNLTFFWGTDANLSSAVETGILNVSEEGLHSILLSNLGTSSTYYYRAKLVNSGGVSNGDAISVSSAHHWELNDSGSISLDQSGIANGVISGATLATDPIKGQVLSFDGDDDFVNFGDMDEMDQIDKFTLSLWFKRSADNSVQASNHGVDNILVAQSSSASNDNFEIGTQGSQIEIYIDSGTAATDQTVRVDAGITNDVWYHLALVYGSELTVYLDGVKKNTWTQYNGRLESSGISPLSIGIARPDSQRWGEFRGQLHREQLFYNELSSEEIPQLAGLGGIRSFTTGSLPVPPVVETAPLKIYLIEMPLSSMNLFLMTVHNLKLFCIGAPMIMEKILDFGIIHKALAQTSRCWNF